eukprot:167707_1
MSKTKKLVICGFLVILTTMSYITYQFLVSEESDYKIRIPVNNDDVHIISMISLLSNASKNICIFVWKQMIHTFQRKEKAVTLSIPIIIRWIDCNKSIGNKSDNYNKSIEVCLADIMQKNEIETKEIHINNITAQKINHNKMDSINSCIEKENNSP